MSVGKNSYIKTHPLQAAHAKLAGEPYKVYLHAEIHAISLCRDLTKAHSMKIFRFLEDGSPADARPCVVCCSAIKASGIQIVDYT